MSKGSKAKRAKPPLAKSPLVMEEPPCRLCEQPMTREYGSLMCSNRDCPAFRGKV